MALGTPLCCLLAFLAAANNFVEKRLNLLGIYGKISRKIECFHVPALEKREGDLTVWNNTNRNLLSLWWTARY